MITSKKISPSLFIKKHFRVGKIKQGRALAILSKRQRFILSVILLSAGLFASEYFFTGYGFAMSFLLGILTDVFFYFSMSTDSKDQLSTQSFLLPFLYSLSFGLFYFLTPSRLLSRIVVTSIYAIGLYSLFLTENIFTVASIRTIALLNGARIVSFVITLVSYFFLVNIIFSLRIAIIPTAFFLLIVSFLLFFHAIWSYTLEQSLFSNILWVLILSGCILQLGITLWFWPTSPTVVALFLTGMLYILAGLSHVWLDRRMFGGVIWEYMWVALFAFIVLLTFTSWQ